MSVKKYTEMIRLVREKYKKELDARAMEHARKDQQLQAQRREIEGKDHARRYQDKYAEFTREMEAYYQKIRDIESKTHGLTFRTEDYLRKAKILYLDAGERNVESAFHQVMMNCDAVVASIEGPCDMEQYAAYLVGFCDLIHTMRYIDKNSRSLLVKSGIPEAEKKAALAAKDKEIAAEAQRYAFVTRLENMKCHGDVVKLKGDLEAAYSQVESGLLGKTKLGDDKQYRYMIGYYREDVPEEELRFCEKVLGLDRKKIGMEPLYLEACTERNNLIINAPSAFWKSEKAQELVRNIYLAVASKVDKNMLQLGYIECVMRQGNISPIYAAIDCDDPNNDEPLLGKDGQFCYQGVNIDKSEGDSVRKCIAKIGEDCRALVNRNKRYGGNVKSYNLENENTKIPLKLVFISSYPCGFEGDQRGREDVPQMLKDIMREFKISGCMIVVCQETDHDAQQQQGVRISGAECNAIECDLNEGSWNAKKELDQCVFTVDGRQCVLSNVSSEFNESEYWRTLETFYMRGRPYELDEVITHIQQQDLGKTPDPFEDGYIDIPIGMAGSSVYSVHYDINKACHTAISGGSGSGKSSFMHSFILSLCYRYSAKDVQIYLADFKNVEFQFYAKNPLPHIRYFLANTSAADVLNMLDFMTKIHEERMALFTACDCQNLSQYNRKAKECTDGSLEKLPMIFFIIDETNVLFTVAQTGNREKQGIIDRVNALINLTRASGVALILAGQAFEGAFKQPQNVIVLRSEDADRGNIKKFFQLTDNSVFDFLRLGGGRCFIQLQGGQGTKVRSAYSGGPGTMKDYVRQIRNLPRPENQEDHKMLLGGSEKLVQVSADEQYMQTLQQAQSQFMLPMGLSSAMGRVNSLAMSGGWCIKAKSGMVMARLLQNAAIAFLYKTALTKYDYREKAVSKRVVYIGENRSYNEAFGGQIGDAGVALKVSNVVPSYIEQYNVTQGQGYAAIQTIMALYREMEIRKKELDAKAIRFYETTDYPPYLVIFQSLECFGEKEIERILRTEQKQRDQDKKQQRESRQAASAAQAPVEMDERSQAALKQIEALGIASFAMAQKAQAFQKGNKTAEEEIPESRAVSDALKALYAKGGEFGIFILAVSADKNDIKTVFNGNEEQNVLLETVAETSGPDNKKAEPDSICYIGADLQKTRLYDYSYDQTEWWEQFEKTMKGA